MALAGLGTKFSMGKNLERAHHVTMKLLVDVARPQETPCSKVSLDNCRWAIALATTATIIASATYLRVMPALVHRSCGHGHSGLLIRAMYAIGCIRNAYDSYY